MCNLNAGVQTDQRIPIITWYARAASKSCSKYQFLKKHLLLREYLQFELLLPNGTAYIYYTMSCNVGKKAGKLYKQKMYTGNIARYIIHKEVSNQITKCSLKSRIHSVLSRPSRADLSAASGMCCCAQPL